MAFKWSNFLKGYKYDLLVNLNLFNKSFTDTSATLSNLLIQKMLWYQHGEFSR